MSSAATGHNPSFTWRSILKGREVLDKGSYWVVGNGSSLNVWEDRWIPRPIDFKVLSAPKDNETNLRVIDLIDWSCGRWRTNLVKEVLHENDAKIVLNLRLSNHDIANELVWFHTKNGSFSVRSAYHMLMEGMLSSSGSASSADNMSKVWKKLWSIKVTPRLKDFLWRAGREILPCMINLFRRKVVEDGCCHVCGKDESVCHVLFECGFAKQVWRLSGIFKQNWSGNAKFLDVFFHFTQGASTETIKRWVFIMEKVWRARNCAIFEGMIGDPEEIIISAQADMDAFERELVRDLIQMSNNYLSNTTGWSPPTLGLFKCNSDASLSGSLGCSIGVIIRDENGAFVGGGQMGIQETSSIEIAEAEGVLFAMKKCIELGITHAVFETDCLVLINHLNTRKVETGVLKNVLNEIRCAAEEFSLCSWVHCRRQANRCAHFLATTRPCVNLFSLSLSSFPVSFTAIVAKDLEVT